MIPKKFRAYDTELGKYRTFYLSELLLDAPNFEFIDHDTIKQFCYRHSKKTEFYEGDQVGFSRQGNPLSIEPALILVDNNGQIYHWDERFFDEPNDLFPLWLNHDNN